jgi:predicted DNA-binding transcriptional regulator AlpA
VDEESKPVTARELANRLGMSLAHFYRARDRLHVITGLPQPLMAGGRLVFDRALVDEYLVRHQPVAQRRHR